MPKFNYKAVKPQSQGGGEVSGSLNAASAEDVMEALQARGVFPVEIKEQATAAMRGAGAGGQQFKAFKGQTSQTSGGILSAAKNALTPSDAKRNKKHNVGELLNEMKENQTTIKGMRTPKARFEKRQKDKRDRDKDRRERDRDKIFESMKTSLGSLVATPFVAGAKGVGNLAGGLTQDFKDVLGPVGTILDLPFIRTVKDVGFNLIKDLAGGVAGSFGFGGGGNKDDKKTNKQKEAGDSSSEVPKLLKNLTKVTVAMADGIADRLHKLTLAVFHGDGLIAELLDVNGEENLDGWNAWRNEAGRTQIYRTKVDREKKREALKKKMSAREAALEAAKRAKVPKVATSVAKGGGGGGLLGMLMGIIPLVGGLLGAILPAIAGLLPVLLSGAMIVTMIAGLAGAVVLAMNWDTVVNFLKDALGITKMQEEAFADAEARQQKATQAGEQEFKTSGGKTMMKKIDDKTGEETFRAVSDEERAAAEEEGFAAVTERTRGGKGLGLREGEAAEKLRSGDFEEEEFQSLMQQAKLSPIEMIFKDFMSQAQAMDEEFRKSYSEGDWVKEAMLDVTRGGGAFNAWGESWAGEWSSLAERVRTHKLLSDEQKAQIFAQTPFLMGAMDGSFSFDTPWMLGESFGELNLPAGEISGGYIYSPSGEHESSDPNRKPANIDKAFPKSLRGVDMGRTTVLAKGGLVRKSVVALMGEAGPEIVMPLDKSVEIVGGMLGHAMDSSLSVSSNAMGKAHLAEELATNSKLNGGSSPTVVVANTTNSPTSVQSTNINSSVSTGGGGNHPSFRRSGRDQTRAEMF